MKKQYKIQLPKGKKVTMTNVDFENGVMTVNVELEKDDSKIWDKMIQEYGEAICGKTEQKYEPKDGDFVFFNYGTEPTIAIYKGIHWESAIITYASCCNMLLTTYEKTIVYWANDIRPATEREKKILIDKLAEKGKKWNPETKRIEDVRWIAEVGETFFYIDTDGRINSMNRDDFHYLWKRYDSLSEQLEDERMGNVEYMLWKKGNYFKNREAAEKVAEQIREIFKNSKAE